MYIYICIVWSRTFLTYPRCHAYRYNVLQLFLKSNGHEQGRRLVVDLEVKWLIVNDALRLLQWTQL